MSRFSRLSIKHKLIVILMLSGGAALLVAYASFFLYELVAYRNSTSREMQTIAQMVGQNSAAALTFNDVRAAEDTLSALRVEPSIVEARIYTASGTLFATYPPGTPPVTAGAGPDGANFSEKGLELYARISLEGERIGTVYLRTDLSPMYTCLWRYAGIAGVVTLLSWLATLALSSALQKVISAPVMHLAETATRVCTERNYSLRATTSGHDEMGALVDRFNETMAQIQSRDAELQAARDRLEDRVAERTHALEAEVTERRRIQENLVAAKLAAEASNRAKSAFLANMSHELRTPLNAIIGYSELLEESIDDNTGDHPQCRTDLQRIHGAGRHLLSLVNEVLDLSKIEAGRMEVRLEMVRIPDVVAEVASTAAPLARVNRNRLVVRADQAGDVIYADPIRFRQSLLNLLSNACKFTEDGTVTLDVTQRAVGGRTWVLWQVSDTGTGIAPDQMSKLFRPFSQVDSSTTRKHGGTGLGLAISERFCRMMGGRITVESELGKGSAFTIWIPSGTEHWPPDGGTDPVKELARLDSSVRAWQQPHGGKTPVPANTEEAAEHRAAPERA